MPQWPYAAIDYLCRKVGIMRVTPPPSVPGIECPDGLALWKGSYAQLLLWPVLDRPEASSLRVEALRGQDWFDQVLLTAEGRDSQPIDGYLILALGSSPTQDERPIIQSLEFSTQVCRKHTIWPDVDSYQGWHGLLDITALAPPDGIASANGTEWPVLDEAAEALWRRVTELGYNVAVARDVEEP